MQAMSYFPIEGGAWMTLKELEALGTWDHSSGQKGLSAYSALALVGRSGGKAYPSNGLAIFISQVDMSALLREMVAPMPYANDWS